MREILEILKDIWWVREHELLETRQEMSKGRRENTENEQYIHINKASTNETGGMHVI